MAVNEEQQKIADKIQKDLVKKHGDIPVVYDAKKLIDTQKKIVSVGPTLDIALGGGILEGTWTILSGPPKCGKTMTALQIAANAQKDGRFVYLFSIESRIKPRDIEGINGFNIDMCKIIQSEAGCILTAEDFLNDAMFVIKNHPGCVVILDSASALCSSGEFSKDITSTGRADGPKLLASFCRQMAGVVPAQNCIVIIIQHLIANTSGYGAPFMEDGGRKITYQFDTKIRCKGVTKWLEGEKKQIGNILNWEIVGSPLGPPGGTTESYVRFGRGIDSEMELVVVGTDLGLISKGGSWYTLDFLLEESAKTIFDSVFPEYDEKEKIKLVKFQGEYKVKEFLFKNPSIKEELFRRVQELS